METSFDLSQFLEALASGDPTPGGGSAAAVGGALAAALAAMVARLTAGRKRYAAVDEEMREIAREADRLRLHLQQLSHADARAFDRVSAAYRLPKETDAQKAARDTAIQGALKGASVTPRDTVEACLALLRLLRRLAEAGNRNALTDAGVGALLAHAALQGAAYNVRVNLLAIEDARFTADHQAMVTAALAEGQALATQIAAQVEAGV